MEEEQRISRFALCACLPFFQKRRKRRSLEDRCCVAAHQSAQIIAKRTALGARLNSLPNVAIASGRLRRQRTDLSCSSTQELCHPRNFNRCGMNVTSLPQYS